MENENQNITCVVCGKNCAGDLLVENTKGEMVPVCENCYHYECELVYKGCKLGALKVTPLQARETINKYGAVFPITYLNRCKMVVDDYYRIDGYQDYEIPEIIAKKYTYIDGDEVKEITTNELLYYDDRFHWFECRKCGIIILSSTWALRHTHPELFLNNDFFCSNCMKKLKIATDFATGNKTADFTKYENHTISRQFLEDFKERTNWTECGSYGSHPAFLPLTNCKKIKSFAGFGIELETEGDSSDCFHDRETTLQALYNEFGELFYGQRDGSLDDFTGLEITTRPFDYANFLKIDWLKFCDILRGQSRKSGIDEDASDCGMHVHASRLLFGKNQKQQNYNIAKVLLFFKKNEDALWRFAKRTDPDCAMALDIESTFKAAKDLACYPNYNQSSRYYAINLKNENTVEFRLFDGTTNADLITARIEFLYLLITNIKKYRYEADFLNVKNLFKGASDNLKKQLLDCGLLKKGDI